MDPYNIAVALSNFLANAIPGGQTMMNKLLVFELNDGDAVIALDEIDADSLRQAALGMGKDVSIHVVSIHEVHNANAPVLGRRTTTSHAWTRAYFKESMARARRGYSSIVKRHSSPDARGLFKTLER